MFFSEQTSSCETGQGPLTSTSIFFLASHLLVSLLFFVLFLVAWPINTAFASEFELSRIANELNLASDALAKGQGHSERFTGLSHRASSLAHESSQLIDAIHRNRNPSNIRSQFNDVSRRYTDLEDAFWRGYSNGFDNNILQQLELISKIYSDLYTAYTLTRYYQQGPQVHIFVSPGTSRNGLVVPPIFFNTPALP
ncbi:MAG: hypothetical protein ACJA2Q_001216 [Pseudohongiellaceae bacterium]|jgi:hypothetical protein